MIDLHCHLLPGIDDGSPDEERSIEMARMAVAEGVVALACTPHIMPGVYDNSGPDIRRRVALLQERFDAEGVALQLMVGADVHIAPDMVSKLRSGEVLTLNDTRYVLIETPHHILPPRVEDSIFNLMAAGYVPIFTHPERMSWIERKYDLIQHLARAGVWMQLTAGALTGRFGPKAQYWSERMLDEGMFQIIATDAHDISRRPPALGEALAALAERVGEDEAWSMISTRPRGVVANLPPSELVAAVDIPQAVQAEEPLLQRLTNMLRGGA